MKLKYPLCNFENDKKSIFCKKCNETLLKQGYSEDNPYVKKNKNENRLNDEHNNEEDEMRKWIEKEEILRAEVKAKTKKK